ncbi:MAG TPA: hypothetical protein GX528_09735 [Firmicutes bacterium]|nr:hypothetical protein [Bacillota bacterium]
MMKIGKTLRLIILAATFASALAGAAKADFGYGDVYWLDEETGEWVLEYDDRKAVILRTEDGAILQGNANSTTAISIALEIENSETAGLAALSMGDENFHAFRSEDDIFSITAIALPDQDYSAQWDCDEEMFSLEHEDKQPKWQFIYEITNNLDAALAVFEVTDSFATQLEIESWAVQMSGAGGLSNMLLAEVDGKSGFTWKGTGLEPGRRAQVSLITAPRQDPTGKRRLENGLHELNSGALLRYELGSGQQKISKGRQFKLRVRAGRASVSLEISATEIAWYIRRPGDYFAKAFDGAVRTSGGTEEIKIGVTFSRFGNLTSESNKIIPVFYSFGSNGQPGQWISPAALNGKTELELKASAANDSTFSLWQRVVSGAQSVGTYQNWGVITFTLVNSQAYHAIGGK